MSEIAGKGVCREHYAIVLMAYAFSENVSGVLLDDCTVSGVSDCTVTVKTQFP